jgi:hypothetical protein
MILFQSKAFTWQSKRPLDQSNGSMGSQFLRLEVMHSLHCLNAIRKSMDPEYYAVYEKQKMPAEVKRIHDGKPSL